MNVLGCLAALLAMTLAYLSARNQRLLARPLGKGCRVAAWACALLAGITWSVSERSLPGIVSALTAFMVGAVAWPYVAWLFRPATDRKPR
jgi:hypothetical protein